MPSGACFSVGLSSYLTTCFTDGSYQINQYDTLDCSPTAFMLTAAGSIPTACTRMEPGAGVYVSINCSPADGGVSGATSAATAALPWLAIMGAAAAATQAIL
jgi:hypothetical protein